MSTAVDEKTEGQARSVGRLDETLAQAFLDLVRALPAGAEFSVNDLRDRLDDLGIPPSARGALFNRAVREELIDPLVVMFGSRTFSVIDQSTGRSARRADVKVYRRSDTS